MKTISTYLLTYLLTCLLTVSCIDSFGQQFVVNPINCNNDPPTALVCYEWPTNLGTINYGTLECSWINPPSVDIQMTVVKIYGIAELSTIGPTNLTIEFELTDTTPFADASQVPPVAELEYNLVLTHETCNGNDGVAEIQIVGNGMADVLWSDSSTFLFSDGLSSGSYWVMVTDAICGGPSDFLWFDIEEFTPISATAATTDVLACGTGGVFGSVSLSIEGGQAPYTVFWTPITGDGFEGAENSMFVVTDAGTIGFVIQDVNECESDADVVLVEADELSATMTLIPTDLIVGTTAGGATNILCYGTIEVEFDGPEGFEFELSPYPGVDFDPATNSFHPLISAPYTVIATAGGALGNGCVITEEVSLELVPWDYDIYDLNGDGVVNFTDLTIFLGLFGGTCEDEFCPGDFNGDGVVGWADLTLLLGVMDNVFAGCP